MYCTTLHLQKRILYRGLFFILSMGLLLQSFAPLRGQEVWDETLLSWPSSIQRCRRRRYRRGHGIVWLAFLRRRRWVLLCRLGLIAALLVWGGWAQRWSLAWALLSLPLIDVLLSLLPGLWPGVLKVPAYLYLVRRVQDLYRFTAATLFWVGLFRFLSSSEATQWSLLVGGSVRAADGAWAQGEIEEDGTWRLEMEGHFTLIWKPRNCFEERVLLMIFRQIRTPQSTPKRPFLRQEWLAEWFGVYQELISRWQRYVREGGLEKLTGAYDGWVATPEIQQAILDIWVPNFWLSAAQVRERLWAAGHISSLKEISENSIHRVAQGTGFAEVRRLLRQMFRFTAEGPQWRDDVLIERLFELNERLMVLLQEGGELTPQLVLEVESLKQGLGAPATPPKKRLPFAYRLQRPLFGQWEEIDDGSIRCPHCGSDLVRRKENTPRRKKYRDPETRAGRETEGYRCYCLNPDCACQTFTNYPDAVRLYSSWTVDMVIWGVMIYMRMRTTYRLAAEAVGVSHVTL